MPSAEDDDWELCDDDGFVFKRKRRLPNPHPSPAADVDNSAALLQRRDRKRRTLLKLKDKYQREIQQWDLLSNDLRQMEARANQLRKEQEEAREREHASPLASSPSPFTKGKASAVGSLLDELTLHVIYSFCDIIIELFSVNW